MDLNAACFKTLETASVINQELVEQLYGASIPVWASRCLELSLKVVIGLGND